MTVEGKGAASAARRLKVWLRVVIAIAVVVTMAGIAAGQVWIGGLPNTYTSSVSIAFAPKPTASGGLPGSESLTLQAAKYQIFLDSAGPATVAAAASGIPETSMAGAIGAEISPGTATLRVAVTWTDPSQATIAARSLGDQVMAKAKSDPVLTAELIAPAAEPTKPSGPARTIMTAFTVIVSVVVGFALLLLGGSILHYLSVTPKGRRLPTWLRIETSEPGRGDAGTPDEEVASPRPQP